MKRADVLLRLIGIHFRRYSHQPETREVAARNLLVHAFLLYAEHTDVEMAQDAVLSAYTLQEALEAA